MSAPEQRLAQTFFDRSCPELARDLLGRFIKRDEVTLRITEVEAYCGPADTACHAKVGRTARTEPMFGPPGRVYVYLCYGIHQMLNLVAGPPGAAVLVRACEPVDGIDVIRGRRGGKSGSALLAGPGRVGAALALDGSFNHHAVYEPGGIEVLHGTPVERCRVGPRVGIDYAAPADRDAPLRYAVVDDTWVSNVTTLT
ncbi:MAG: DNA-3-methyladenine glycosylase [Myxococcales bacterium]|nr:DNA-3-methyladenine glycosylase [Myxococcales bacterium]